MRVSFFLFKIPHDICHNWEERVRSNQQWEVRGQPWSHHCIATSIKANCCQHRLMSAISTCFSFWTRLAVVLLLMCHLYGEMSTGVFLYLNACLKGKKISRLLSYLINTLKLYDSSYLMPYWAFKMLIVVWVTYMSITVPWIMLLIDTGCVHEEEALSGFPVSCPLTWGNHLAFLFMTVGHFFLLRSSRNSCSKLWCE